MCTHTRDAHVAIYSSCLHSWQVAEGRVLVVSWLQQLGEFVSAAVFRYKHQPSEAPYGRHGQWQRQQSLAKAVVIDLRFFLALVWQKPYPSMQLFVEMWSYSTCLSDTSSWRRQPPTDKLMSVHAPLSHSLPLSLTLSLSLSPSLSPSS